MKRCCSNYHLNALTFGFHICPNQRLVDLNKEAMKSIADNLIDMKQKINFITCI